MSRNTWLIFIAVCALLLTGLVLMSRGNRIDVSDVDHTKILSASSENGQIADHVLGDSDAKLTIIEYGDYQCPGCRSAAPVLKAMVNKYDQSVNFVFRNYPLPGHNNARAASAAAEAAGLQGKYWQMHDRLYENQQDWSSLSGTTRTDMFADYADMFDLDREKFVSDLSSPQVRQKINFDAALGRDVGVTGTPSIFVNGKEITSYYKDDKLVPKSTPGSNPVWSNVEAFEQLVIVPNLRSVGVELPASGDK